MVKSRFLIVSLLSSLLLTLSMSANSANRPDYSVDAIADNMLENADVVYRNVETRVVVNSPGSLSYSRKIAVTIMRESGIGASRLRIEYNRLRRVGSVSGTIYDSEGNRVRRIRSSDIDDMIAFDGFSIYSDSRVKTVDPGYYNYPFTVEYEYDYTIRTGLFMPDYHLFMGYNRSIEKSSFEVVAPEDVVIKYREYNGMAPAVIESGRRSTRIYRWENSDFQARRSESYAPDPSSLFPVTRVMPLEFTIENYSGSSDSWESFGRFFWSLMEHSQELPEETIAMVRELVADAGSVEEKVARVFRYSQRKNRYVSIQIGAGGIIPFDAASVDRLSYGDCKALSNYVVALLDAVGVESHYTLVFAGNRPVAFDPGFVASYFNHAILCVPNSGDTIWLETTNSHLPVDHLGDFTDDRYVLIVTPEGGVLERTPAYSHSENSVSSVTRVQLRADGSAEAAVFSETSGARYMSELSLTLMDSHARERSLLARLAMPGSVTVLNSEINPVRERHGVVTREVTVLTDNCVSRLEGMLLVKAHFNVAPMSVPPFSRRREGPVTIVRNSERVDTTYIEIPEGYTVGSLPECGVVAGDMVGAEYSYEYDNGRVMSVRRLWFNKGSYPAGEFNEFRALLERIAARDGERVVLREAEGDAGPG